MIESISSCFVCIKFNKIVLIKVVLVKWFFTQGSLLVITLKVSNCSSINLVISVTVAYLTAIEISCIIIDTIRCLLIPQDSPGCCFFSIYPEPFTSAFTQANPNVCFSDFGCLKQDPNKKTFTFS